MIAHPTIAIARTDSRDWLIDAQEPLAGLQRRAGGELPGPIVAPALLDLVRKARNYGLKLARRIEARDDDAHVSAWVEVQPGEGGDGCRISVTDWRSRPLPHALDEQADVLRSRIARDIADFTARLGPDQTVLAITSHGYDTAVLARQMEAGVGRHWAEFVTLDDGGLHFAEWRKLDKARLRLPGSDRNWTAHLHPLGKGGSGSLGFELALVAVENPPLAPDLSTDADAQPSGNLGRDVAPALRQPVARIIANAETIRSQLAGPLAPEYTNYAADIASAGEHLLALIDDLDDLEAAEDDAFTTAPDQIDLADVARRAAGILAIRAQQKAILIETPSAHEIAPAIGEFRRVLQILLNLLGNAIRYSPSQSTIRVSVGRSGEKALVTVADEGDGLNAEDQPRIFDKFERLGRKGDGGSGLGLYISRRLARAMDGDLQVDSTRGQGARFVLELPRDPAHAG